MLSWLDKWIAAKYSKVVRDELDLHAYQQEAGDFLWETPYSALFIDTGLGKTIIILTLLVRLMLSFAFNKALIIAPVRVAAETWPTEIGKWQHTAALNYQVIRAEDDDEEVQEASQAALAAFRARPDAQELETARREALYWAVTREEREAAYKIPCAASEAQKARTAKKQEMRLRFAASKASVHIINREALEWLVDQYTVWVTKKGCKPKRKIVGWPYDVVIIDESSSFKDHKAQRFHALAAVRAQGFIARLHELTATPAAESYMGLFAQFFLIDLGKRFGRGITHFQQSYFSYNQYKRKHTLLPGAKERISELISDAALVMLSGDYLEEEEPLFLTREINMSPKELAQYKAFERNFVLEMDDGEVIEAESASALSSKLLQLASGAVYNAKKETKVLHNHKIEDLKELVDELQGSPIMVAYWYKSSLARLKKAFPHAQVIDKKGRQVGPWNAGKIQMLLVHPASVGFGLNLQEGPGHDLYMFDQCWSWELFYQLYRRLHRQGQKLRVRVHQALTVGTNDEIVVERLGQKEDAQSALFERIKWLRKRLKAAKQTTYRMAA